MGTGQGKLPLDAVTDNALRKRKYEQDELEGAQPLMGTTSSGGGVGFTSVMGPISAAEYAALTPSADVAYFVTGVGVYVGASLIADLGGVGGTSRQFALRKRGMLIANNATSTLVAMSQSAKTVTFPAGVRLIDDTVGFYYELPTQQVLSLGAYNTGLIYFDTADNTIKFRNISTSVETDSVYDTFHSNAGLYIIGAIDCNATTKTLGVNATYYSVDGEIFGRSDKYFNDQISAMNSNFGSDAQMSPWFVGQVSTLTTAGVKSVITAIKDVWFDFHEGKPAWWDDCRLRFTCVFRPNYTGSPTNNDTLFQFRIVSSDGATVNTILNFYRWELELVGLSGLNLYTKTISVNGENVRINIYADISSYASPIPVPRDDTTFMVWCRLKTDSQYKSALSRIKSKSKIYYGGNELFVTDQWPTNIFKRGLTTDADVRRIALVTKSLPLVANFVSTPNDPSAFTILQATARDSKLPSYKYSADMLSVSYQEAGDQAVLVPDWERIENVKYGVGLTVRKKQVSSIVNKTLNVMCFGASSTDSGLASYLRLLFTELGLTFVPVGTKYDYYGSRCEGRGGWAAAMYTGISSLDNAATPVVVPLAAPGATTTAYENPFLYLATPADKTNRPNWCFRRTAGGARAEKSYTTDTDKSGDFYIFDFARYMSDRSVTAPDAITIQLGMNDYYTTYYSTAQAGVNYALAIDIIYSQIRAALPNVPIFFTTYLPRYTNTAGYSSVSAIRNLVDILNGYVSTKSGDANLHVISTHCLMNPDLGFDFNLGGAIDASGNNTKLLSLAAPADGVHGQKNYYQEFARVVAGGLLTVMS